jgi:hypothetical protein
MLVSEMVIALVVALAAALAYKVRGRSGILVVVIVALLAIEAYVLHDRAVKVGTIFQYEEPLWVTVLGVGIPVLALGVSVDRMAARRWNFAVQVLGGVMVEVLSSYVIAALLFVIATFVGR